jgi:hypothetical protein
MKQFEINVIDYEKSEISCRKDGTRVNKSGTGQVLKVDLIMDLGVSFRFSGWNAIF